MKLNDAILNPKGTKEVVEFFDYNCIHCKREFEVVKKLLEEKKEVKLVLKPIIILGEMSMYATEIGHAINIIDPKKYEKFFDMIMNRFSGSDDPLMSAIKSCGIDVEKLKEVLDSKKDEIAAKIQEDSDLADKLGVEGTPAFYINKKLYAGEQDLATLEKAIK